MIRKLFAAVILIPFLLVILQFVSQVRPTTELGQVANKYVKDGPDELGAANLVTSVVVTYRGLDTLGEVTVLFIATAGVGFLLGRRKEDDEDDSSSENEPKREASEFLDTGSKFLMPFLFLFGVYVFTHGHLTPGGGFQGGVIIASAILLAILSSVSYRFKEMLLELVESLSGFSYVVVAVLGIVLAGGFLDNRIMDLGVFGHLFSAGAIGIIYSLVGLKVGSELVGILKNMSDSEE